MNSKITAISYIGTYFAIATAWVLTTVNYFLKGWWTDHLDRYYIYSWQVWFSIFIVFNCLGNFGLAGMRYRFNERTLISAVLENFKWTVMLAILLGGLSLHLSMAILSHAFEVQMTWGATAKKLEISNFFKEMPKIFKNVCAFPLPSLHMLTLSLSAA